MGSSGAPAVGQTQEHKSPNTEKQGWLAKENMQIPSQSV